MQSSTFCNTLGEFLILGKFASIRIAECIAMEFQVGLDSFEVCIGGLRVLLFWFQLLFLMFFVTMMSFGSSALFGSEQD